MATRPTSAFITDRTEEDVKNRTKKAFNNFSDIKRIQDWINYFIDETGLDLPKYEWKENQRVDLMDWYFFVLRNTEKIYSNVFSRTIQMPTFEKWDWEKQNQLESILSSISEKI